MENPPASRVEMQTNVAGSAMGWVAGLTAYGLPKTTTIKKLSYCRGTARRSKSVEVFPTAAQLYEKLH